MYDHNGGIYVGLWWIAPNDTDEEYSGISFKVVSGLGGNLIVLVAAGLWLG